MVENKRYRLLSIKDAIKNRVYKRSEAHDSASSLSYIVCDFHKDPPRVIGRYEQSEHDTFEDIKQVVLELNKLDQKIRKLNKQIVKQKMPSIDNKKSLNREIL